MNRIHRFSIENFLNRGSNRFIYRPNIIPALLFVLTLSAATPSLCAQIDIPLDTWVARPLPGVGKAPAGGMKHQRIAYNPVNQRLYFLGGDYAGTDYGASGRNEIFSYSVELDEWTLEQPYCRPDNDYQPAGPDQVGWTYDTKRKVFWMFPGYMTRTSVTNCADSERVILGRIMSYDPAANTWSFEDRTNSTGGPSIRKFGHYDPVNDSFFRFGWDGAPRMEIYAIDADSWEYITFGSQFNSAYLGWDYNALDLVNRVMYVVSATEGKLLRYDLDSKSLSYISDLPPGPVNREGNYAIWDSVNSVLLWSVGGSKGQIDFYVYHPTDSRWEQRPVSQPEGYTVKGNAAIFDPVQNTFLLIGGYEPSNPYVFLYRYANGDGAAPPIQVPPSDSTPPTIQSAQVNSAGTQITIVFSEKVNNTDAENSTNYQINGLNIAQASIATDQRTVVLNVGKMTENMQYQITVNNIHDLALNPNAIAKNSFILVVYAAPGLNETSTIPGNYVWDALEVGKPTHIDSTESLIDIPDTLVGLSYLRTSNADRMINTNPFVSFSMESDKTVYVAYDTRNTILPEWLNAWQSTTFQLVTSDTTLQLYSKDYVTGTVSLGGNNNDNGSMYIVVLGAENTDTGNGTSDNNNNPAESDNGGSIDWSLLALLSILLAKPNWRRRKQI